jgi:hypothetical protein
LLKPSFDLHVLSTPPAFILSQDQTLRIFASSHTSRCLFLTLLSSTFPHRISTGFSITLQLLRCCLPVRAGNCRQKSRCHPISVPTSGCLRDAFPGTGPLSSLVIDLPSFWQDLLCVGRVLLYALRTICQGVSRLIRISYLKEPACSFHWFCPAPPKRSESHSAGCIIRGLAGMSRDSVNCMTN